MLIEDEIRVDMKKLIDELRLTADLVEMDIRKMHRINKKSRKNQLRSKPRPVDAPSKIRKLFRP